MHPEAGTERECWQTPRHTAAAPGPGRTRRPRCHPSRGTPYGPCGRIRLPRPARRPAGQWQSRRRPRGRAWRACRASARTQRRLGPPPDSGPPMRPGRPPVTGMPRPIRPAREPAALAPDGPGRWAASALRSLQRLPPRSPLPSLDGGPPSREQHLTVRPGRRHKHLSCIRERAMDPTACTPKPGPSGSAGKRHGIPLPRLAFLPPTTLGGVDG